MRYVKVRFEDNRSYVYTTIDMRLNLGTRVNVLGKRAGQIGVVVEDNCSYSRGAPAPFEIAKVLEYGPEPDVVTAVTPIESEKSTQPEKVTQMKVYYHRIELEDNLATASKLRSGNRLMIRRRPFRMASDAMELCTPEGQHVGFITTKKDRGHKTLRDIKHGMGLWAKVVTKNKKYVAFEIDTMQKAFPLSEALLPKDLTGPDRTAEARKVRNKLANTNVVAKANLGAIELQDKAKYPNYWDSAKLGTEHGISVSFGIEQFEDEEDYKDKIAKHEVWITLLDQANQPMATFEMLRSTENIWNAKSYSAVLTELQMAGNLTLQGVFTLYAFNNADGVSCLESNKCAVCKVGFGKHGVITDGLKALTPVNYTEAYEYRELLFLGRHDKSYDVYAKPAGPVTAPIYPLLSDVRCEVTFKWGSVYWVILERNGKRAVIFDQTPLDLDHPTMGLDFRYDRIEGSETLWSTDPTSNNYCIAERDGVKVFVNKTTGFEEEPKGDIGPNRMLEKLKEISEELFKKNLE
jgi:hypothetical protein